MAKVNGSTIHAVRFSNSGSSQPTNTVLATLKQKMGGGMQVSPSNKPKTFQVGSLSMTAPESLAQGKKNFAENLNRLKSTMQDAFKSAATQLKEGDVITNPHARKEMGRVVGKNTKQAVKIAKMIKNEAAGNHSKNVRMVIGDKVSDLVKYPGKEMADVIKRSRS